MSEEVNTRNCTFHNSHANRFCHTPMDHHLLKYHDPESHEYIGIDCVNCVGTYLELRLEKKFKGQIEEGLKNSIEKL